MHVHDYWHCSFSRRAGLQFTDTYGFERIGTHTHMHACIPYANFCRLIYNNSVCAECKFAFCNKFSARRRSWRGVWATCKSNNSQCLHFGEAHKYTYIIFYVCVLFCTRLREMFTIFILSTFYLPSDKVCVDSFGRCVPAPPTYLVYIQTLHTYKL